MKKIHNQTQNKKLFYFVLLGDGSLDGEFLVTEGGSVNSGDSLLSGGRRVEANQGIVEAEQANASDLATSTLEEFLDLLLVGHLLEDGTDEDGDGAGSLVRGSGSLGGGDGDAAAVNLLLVEGSDSLGSGGVGVEPDEGILEATEADVGDVASGTEDVLDVSNGFLSETLDVDTCARGLGGGSGSLSRSSGGSLGRGSLTSGSLGGSGLSGGLGSGSGLGRGFGGGFRRHFCF
jgi:hypothetical protein